MIQSYLTLPNLTLPNLTLRYVTLPYLHKHKQTRTDPQVLTQFSKFSRSSKKPHIPLGHNKLETNTPQL